MSKFLTSTLLYDTEKKTHQNDLHRMWKSIFGIGKVKKRKS